MNNCSLFSISKAYLELHQSTFMQLSTNKLKYKEYEINKKEWKRWEAHMHGNQDPETKTTGRPNPSL